MKQYDFDITISLTDIGIEADSEKEARGKLTEQIAEYFSETTISIGKDEAKLIGITEID